MSKLSDSIERKFIESYDIDEYEVLTDTGWHDVSALHVTVEYREWILVLENGMTLTCADDHIVFDQNFNEIFVKNLEPGSVVITEDGPIAVSSVEETEVTSNMYDLTVESENHRFYTNGILSHNTTTAAVLILHYILFNEYKTVAILANKAAAAREVLSRVQMSFEALPKWMQQGVVSWNKGSIELENGCKCFCAASSSDSIRGKSVNMLYIDEVAFLKNWDEFFTSVYPTISSGTSTKLILTSTPNGMNHFYEICTLAKHGKGHPKWNGYELIEAQWWRVPGRDEAWKEKTLATLNFDVTKFEQEYDCSFGSVSGALLSAFALKSLEAQPPIVSNDHLFKYDEPQRGHSYMLVADVSRGKGLDYSAFSVIDISVMPYKQVCVYRNNQIVPTDYATAIYRIGKMYNEAYVLVENNDAGCQVVDILNLDYGYESLMFTETQNNRKVLSSGFGKNAEGGVRTTKSVKMLGCATMKTLIEGNKLHVVDKNAIIELKNFVRIGDSYAAEAPHHDDITMGLVLFSWAVDQSYFKEISDIDIDGILREKSSDEWDEELLGFGFMTNDDEPSNFLTNTW
jgi:hypothetical protein